MNAVVFLAPLACAALAAWTGRGDGYLIGAALTPVLGILRLAIAEGDTGDD